MGFLDKVKSFFNDEQLEDHEEDYEDRDEWITLDISLMVPYTELVNVKTALKPYADELSWELHSFDDTTDFEKEYDDFGQGLFKDTFKDFDKNDPNVRVSVNLYPGEHLTPNKFLKVKNKIINLVYAMHRDLIYNGDNKKASKEFKETINITYTRQEGHKPKKSDWIVKQSMSFLNIEYPLYKRLSLEKKDKEKAIKIFSRTLEEDVKLLFKTEPKEKTKPSSKKNKEDKLDKQLEESSNKMKKELKDLFGFNI